MHTVLGLQEISLVITAALCGGLLLERFRQPAILGYILAGVLLGPSGIGYIKDDSIIRLFADFGILMVLFVVGVSLDLGSFKRTMWISISVACGQIVIGLLVAFGLSVFMGWTLGFSLLMAFVLALSSTAVAVKMLEASQELNSDVGRLTLGILIAQDLAIVPMILILRDLDHGIQWAGLSLKILVALGILTLFVWWLSRPRKAPLFINFSAERPELPSLMSLWFCFGFATVSGYIGLSVAYGAFLAGLILGNLKERTVILQVIMPIYSVLVMTFFLSVGLYINASFIWSNLWLILFLSFSIIVFKTLANFGILRALRQPWPTTFLAGVTLSQMGEFAFLLISIGWDSRVLSPYARQMLITLTAISLAISPLWMMLYGRLSAFHVRNQATFYQTLNIYLKLIGGWAGHLLPGRVERKKDLSRDENDVP